METEKIHALSVITSSTCNLNCKFCYLHKNKVNHEYNNLIRQAWDDGTYLENIRKVFEKMGNDRNDVTQIHFWGGETLIQVDLLEKNVPKFYELFPNIKSWHISTNWVININNFFTFLKTIDNCAHQEAKIVL